MGTSKKLLFLLLIFPLALYAKAGTGKMEGVLHGYVTDAVTKKPLSGVVVSAIVPGTNSLKEVLTDADGYFRIAQLPASQITVQFDKKGYQSCKRPNVTIKEKASVRLNVEFLPDDMESNSESGEYPVLRLLEAS
ncbi:MAG TPA: carboxypeptidase-like regulatory domain-containing protein [Puia sp.]|jgi:hypothetical protein|nr:carboxypeptidase-like regulatory domain-containing protein [Puia sp.]